MSCVIGALGAPDDPYWKNKHKQEENKMNDGTSEVTKAAFRVLVFQIKQLIKERDEARRVLQTVVEEFISDTPQQTPKHECEFISDPERGVCSACETWSDYVRICHSCENTEEEETQ